MTKRTVLLLGFLAAPALAQAPPAGELARCERRAQDVTITRDDWGIPHVKGKTDADAVFGLMYAQAEDDFNRVETNFLNAMGRLAEAEGESAVYRDLRMKLFIDPEDIQARHAASPAWLQALMQAWADGLNYYLHTHPQVSPRVLRRFEPWMALTFSEGSIGGDIERVNLAQLEAFYGKRREAPAAAEPSGRDEEPRGSNGIAIAASNTRAGHALLLINPHTSFYFRAEAQATSDEGLNAYGALTWGQFFVYQGFNERTGWMHTSSGADAWDEYLETVVKDGERLVYRYGGEQRPLQSSRIVVPFKTASGMDKKEFTVYRTQHGPIVRELDGKWVSMRLMREPVKALQQSYLRTKAKDYKAFRETMELHTNSSNNTVFADSSGSIAYFHANFIPRRDARFDWTKPVDGSDPATEWQGLLSVDESPNLLNPKSGWLYNVNNWPWSAAGASSPRREDHPAYVENGRAESARGRHAIRVLQGRTDFTLDSLVTAAYDTYLPAFEQAVPALVAAYDALPDADPRKAALAEPLALVRGWDYRFAVDSVATTLAIAWAEQLNQQLESASAEQRIAAFEAALRKLAADHGTWKMPWGSVNRFQRLDGAIAPSFDDAAPSLPVAFPSARWGSLASFGARAYKNTKKLYGSSGNSFVAVVEFGDRVRARAVSAGGQSGDPASRHFNDQALRYSTGDLRPVYFYRSDLEGHIEREYHPGR